MSFIKFMKQGPEYLDHLSMNRYDMTLLGVNHLREFGVRRCDLGNESYVCFCL